jgi:hypothetical protein
MPADGRWDLTRSLKVKYFQEKSHFSLVGEGSFSVQKFKADFKMKTWQEILGSAEVGPSSE